MRRAAHPDKPVAGNPRLQAALDALDPPGPPPVFAPPTRAPLGGFLHRKLTVQLFQSESLVELVYRHWIVLLSREVPALGLAALTIVIYVGMRGADLNGVALLVDILVGVFVTLIYGALTYIDWADDVFVLTTHRVIDIDRLFLILEDYSNEVTLTKIQDVRVEQGFWGQVFGFGSIVVDVAGNSNPLAMGHMPDPRRLMNRIFELVEYAQRRTISRRKYWQRREASHWISQVLDHLMLQVPDLTNQPLLTATARARKAGLRLTVDSERTVPGTASGVVVQQTPAPGSIVLAEDSVHVVISGQSSPRNAAP